MLHVMIGVLSSQLMQSEIIIYSLVRKCEALKFLLDNIYNRFGSKLYKQIVGIPMVTKSSPLIGVGSFRKLGGPRLRILGGPNSQQAHDVVMTLMRRNDVASTSFRRHVPPRNLIHQCLIITFLNLKIR